MKYAQIPGRPRSSAGFVQYQDHVYWVGGHVGEFHFYEPGHFSSEAHRLDLSTGEWSQIADFPVPAQGFRMCGHEGGIFAFGGFVYEGDGDWPVRSTAVVRRYDISTNRWEDVGRITTPRSSNVLGVVDDLAYLIGGWNGQSRPNPDTSIPWQSKPGTFHDTIEVFDLKTGRTSEVIPLEIPSRRAFAAVTIANEITVACGLGPKGFADLKTEVLTFSAKTRKWRKLFDTRVGLFSPGLAWPAHAPLVVGGLFVKPDYSQYEEFDSIATFDPHASGGWKTLAHLDSSRTFAECAVFDGELIVLGGHSGQYPTAAVQSFDADHPSNAGAARLEMIRHIDKHSYSS